MRKRKLGYDLETLYSEDDLYQMYINEGKLPDEARSLAHALFPCMRDMFWSLKYTWEKVQEHESPGRFNLEEESE